MATRAVLADLASAYQSRSSMTVAIESVGGVDAAARVRGGEPFDFVVLARDAIDGLVSQGHLVADSVVDLVHSSVAVAVPSGAPHPDISSEEAVRRAVLSARTVGYSTGPSGVRLADLFLRWGIAERVNERIVVPRPGTPVGKLVASGLIALGFQQLSELIGLEGIEVVGPLPADIQIVTTFSVAVGTRARQPDAAKTLLAFLASPATASTKQRHGMSAPDDADPVAAGAPP